MKRLIAAAVLLALIGALLFGNYAVTDRVCRRMTNEVSKIREYYEADRKSDAALKAEAAEKYWGESEGWLLLFLNRATVDEINESLTRLSSYAKSGNDTLFDAESRLCLMMIEHLHESEQIFVF